MDIPMYEVDEHTPEPGFHPLNFADEPCEPLESVPAEIAHVVSRSSEVGASVVEDNQSAEIFAVTAPPKPAVFKRQCITALDLEQVIQHEGLGGMDSQTERVLRLFHKRRHLPSAASAPTVIRQLHRVRVNAILEGDYDRARESDFMAHEVAIAQMKDQERERRHNHILALQEQLDTANHDLQTVHKVKQKEFRDCEEAINKRLAALESAQEAELQAFEARWNSDDFLRRYSKPTPALLNMKAMEKSMVIAKMFDQAKEMRRVASETEKGDTVDRQEMAYYEMNQERCNLLDRHQREKLLLDEKCAQLKEITRKQAELDERPLRTMVARLEKEIEELKQGADDPPITPALASITSSESPELVSARTAYKFAAYRSAASSLKLKIQPMGAVASASKSMRRIRVFPLAGRK
jgi:hypothetical protein